jgi:hypothetical protein
MLQRLKSIKHSPILNFKKRLATATLGLALLAGTTLATTGIVPVKIAGVSNQEPAMAWQSWEHSFGPYINFSNMSQSQADSYCRNQTVPDYRLPSGYLMYFGDDGILFHFWQIRYKWAHKSAGTCVFNT